jgi:hypothetical protein
MSLITQFEQVYDYADRFSFRYDLKKLKGMKEKM